MKPEKEEFIYCLCGRKIFDYEQKEFCSKNCEREYDSMMQEMLDDFFLLLMPTKGNA